MTITNILFVAGGFIFWNLVRAPVIGNWWKFTLTRAVTAGLSPKEIYEKFTIKYSPAKKISKHIFTILILQVFYWFYSFFG